MPADARVAVEETFGPIAPVVAIDSLERAISLTNASPYGLLAAIFTADLQDGLEFADRVHTGWVNINESSNYWEAHLPFGGRAGTDSGIGRVGGSHVMQSFTETADGRPEPASLGLITAVSFRVSAPPAWSGFGPPALRYPSRRLQACTGRVDATAHRTA